jgi:hypothetical protein
VATQIQFRVATEFSVMKVNVSKEGEARIKQFTEEHRCLGCGKKIDFANGERVRRGHCDTCYSGVRHAIRKKTVTEKELMQEGKLLPPAPGGRKPANDFTAAILGRPAPGLPAPSVETSPIPAKEEGSVS